VFGGGGVKSNIIRGQKPICRHQLDFSITRTITLRAHCAVKYQYPHVWIIGESKSNNPWRDRGNTSICIRINIIWYYGIVFERNKGWHFFCNTFISDSIFCILGSDLQNNKTTKPKQILLKIHESLKIEQWKGRIIFFCPFVNPTLGIKKNNTSIQWHTIQYIMYQ